MFYFLFSCFPSVYFNMKCKKTKIRTILTLRVNASKLLNELKQWNQNHSTLRYEYRKKKKKKYWNEKEDKITSSGRIYVVCVLCAVFEYISFSFSTLIGCCIIDSHIYIVVLLFLVYICMIVAAQHFIVVVISLYICRLFGYGLQRSKSKNTFIL